MGTVLLSYSGTCTAAAAPGAFTGCSRFVADAFATPTRLLRHALPWAPSRFFLGRYRAVLVADVTSRAVDIRFILPALPAMPYVRTTASHFCSTMLSRLPVAALHVAVVRLQVGRGFMKDCSASTAAARSPLMDVPFIRFLRSFDACNASPL